MKRKPVLIILCGISNSGKTTWAHERFLEDPDSTAIISRDKLREGLFGFNESNVEYYYHHKDMEKLEETVAAAEMNLVSHFILEGKKTIIVDDTHLKYSNVDRWVIHSLWDVRVKKFPVKLEEALSRNDKRDRRVLPKVIKDQYRAYKKMEKIIEELKKAKLLQEL